MAEVKSQRGNAIRGYSEAVRNGDEAPEPEAAPGLRVSSEQVDLAERFLERQSPKYLRDLPRLLARYAALMVRPSNHSFPAITLTPRQRQVARMLREGMKIREIAKELGVCERAVKDRLGEVYRAYGIAEGCSRIKQVRLVADLLLP